MRACSAGFLNGSPVFGAHGRRMFVGFATIVSMDDLYLLIDDALAAGKPLALSTVIGRRGSLPMSRRAKMIVGGDGSMAGTVGGGCLEAEVYAAARRVLETGYPVIGRYLLTEVEQGTEGHICGGTVTILTEPLLPEGTTPLLYARLRRLAGSGRGAVIATQLPVGKAIEPGPGCGVARGGRRLLVEDDGSSHGDLDGALADSIVIHCSTALQRGQPAVVEADGGETAASSRSAPRFFIDPLVPAPTVVIFGAGHCGRAIGRVAKLAGFHVLLLDDRADFADAERVPWADSVRVVQFDRVLEELTLDDRHYLVIVTRGHQHDFALLRQLIGKPCAYLGMIGSKRKKLIFLEKLSQQGVPQEQLAKLISPMGLPIEADTPEEIAIAVVAEMIGVRRQAPLLAAADSHRWLPGGSPPPAAG
ncbi:MAG: XdhC family protein [Acidobacteriota bacterium]